MPYRFLQPDKRFQKYQWVDVEVSKASSDARPESYKLLADSIKIVSKVDSDDAWRRRKEIIYPLRSPSLCSLVRKRDKVGFPTLGVFKPKRIDRLVIEPEDSPDWTADELAILRQRELFATTPKTELEKIPYVFRYVFTCDDPGCKGHRPMCTDWEMAQTWRSWLTNLDVTEKRVQKSGGIK